MPGPQRARLQAVAATHSCTVTQQQSRLVVTRVGPGSPRRLSARVPTAATEADWEQAAQDLANELERAATPDSI
jgi:hypothetical protein